MSVQVALVLSVAVCSLGVSAAVAQAPRAARVSVDWSRVRDDDIERCGLSRLRSGTIERLVDAGHAVVDRIGAGGAP